MVTDFFLNGCYTLVLSNTKVKKNITLYRDILEILKFYEEKGSGVPIILKNKFDCLKKICELKLEGKTDEVAIDYVISAGKFKDLEPLLTSKFQEEIRDTVSAGHIEQLRLRKKMIQLFSNYDKLSNFVDCVGSGNFDTGDDIIEDYESTIKQLYLDLVEHRRTASIEAAASLDVLNDDYESITEQIITTYKQQRTIPTGIDALDYEVLNGGFEPTRLYIFGGMSGSGKSTFLTNCIVNAALKNKRPSVVYGQEEEDEEKVFIYVTLENLLPESFLRFYCCLFDKQISEAKKDIIEDRKDIKPLIANRFAKLNTNVCMYFFPATTISVVDIMSLIDEVNDKYGRKVVKALYVDYLDILKSDLKHDLYRIELGQLTLSLKVLAVEYNIPVITATQLNRSSYQITKAEDLNLDQVSESVKKIEHADFVAMIATDAVESGKLYIRVGKNRSGKSNMSITTDVDFSKYKISSMKKFIPDNYGKTCKLNEALESQEKKNKGLM